VAFLTFDPGASMLLQRGLDCSHALSVQNMPKVNQRCMDVNRSWRGCPRFCPRSSIFRVHACHHRQPDGRADLR
jgi:hypothetical protein